MGDPLIIFVTVGSHYQGFDRLVKAMDTFAENNEEHVVMQIGNTKYIPRHAEYFKFDMYEKMIGYNNNARVVVSHAGVGSIITAFKLKKIVILVPRMKKLNEAIDDHQLEIAEALSNNNNVRVIFDISDINKYLKENFVFDNELSNNNSSRSLITSIEHYINKV